MKSVMGKRLDSLHRRHSEAIPRWWYERSKIGELCAKMRSVSMSLTPINLTRALQMSTGIQVVKDPIRYLRRPQEERQMYFDPSARMFDDMQSFAFAMMGAESIRRLLRANFE